MRTDSLIILHVQKCSYESISRLNQSNYKKNAHGFTGHFARAEMSVRVDFEGRTIEILFAKYGINIYIPARKSRVHAKRSFSFVLIKTIEAIYPPDRYRLALPLCYVGRTS